jgi:hypothetical protein
MAIINVLLTTTSVTQVINSPLAEERAITTMFFCNNSTATSTAIDIWLVATGSGGPSTSSRVINQLSLPAQETFVFDAEKLILFNGDAIWAKATDSNIVSATISYVKTS